MKKTIIILIVIVIILTLIVGALIWYYYNSRVLKLLAVPNTNAVSIKNEPVDFSALKGGQKVTEEREMTAQEKTDAGLDSTKPAKFIIMTSPYNPDATIRIIDTSANQ